jgi:Xaa-Pro aminopeptidase
MRMMNTALLTGPYDWDASLIPMAEFERRLTVLRHAMAQREIGAMLVHGNSIEHGALGFLTGFTPKLGPAFALVPRDGAIRLLVSGGPGMIPSAKLLTWVADVRSVGSLRNSVAEWLGSVSGDGLGQIGLWGGKKMAQRAYLAVAAAMPPAGRLIDMDDSFDELRRLKSACELGLVCESCRILTVAAQAFREAAAKGSRARTAALAMERAAYANGAQDARVLASGRNGGPPLPLDGPTDARCEPLLACLAVRSAGYWSEGLVTAGAPEGGALVRARAGLAAMLRQARAGATSMDLARAAAERTAGYEPHPLVESTIGNGIGLSLEESPNLGRSEIVALERGGVYSLRWGTAGEGGDNAIVSAMIAVTGSGCETLWPPTELTGDFRIVPGLP